MKIWPKLYLIAIAIIPKIFMGITAAAQCSYDLNLSGVIRDSLQAYVEKGKIAGAVTLVAKDNCIISFEAVGYQDLDAKITMQRNTIFQVRSMTKTITAAGIMLLVDDGKIKLNDPISKYLSEFKSMQVPNRGINHLTLTPNAITIKHLLNHTSGLPEETPTDVRKQFTKPIQSLADIVALAAKVPLLFYPGTEFNYSDIGYNVLGRLIEVASGMSYERFIGQRLFKPMNMLDSYVLLPDSAKKYRIATAYEVKESKLQLSLNYDHSSMSWLTFPRPSWSMFSTASDLLSFYQMLLHGGNYRGKRILSAKSVRLMTSAQVKNTNAPAFGYGFGVYISLVPTDAASAVSFGSYGHGGLLGTRGRVDPEWNMIRIFLIQRLPVSPAEAFIGQERDVFMKLTRSAVTKR